MPPFSPQGRGAHPPAMAGHAESELYRAFPLPDTSDVPVCRVPDAGMSPHTRADSPRRSAASKGA